ncbi:hypothetical protein SMC26_14565 [Actinomadura fulvescens]|uniref:Glycoside hydrolase family 31 TIM barrel domain-containing protein n=1 Tax=Actinomadura fulvescens TaxID=46160 RepID=A0ABP6CG52_9ACTN
MRIERAAFQLRLGAPHDPYVHLDLETFTQPLLVTSGLDTLTEYDRTVSLTDRTIERHDRFERVTWTAKSTLWDKRFHLDVHAGHLEYHYEVAGHGTVDTVHYFEGIDDHGFRPDFDLLKYYLGGGGRTPHKEYATGSPAAFRTVFCPEPTCFAKQYFRPHEYAVVSVTTDMGHHGGHFIVNPGLTCFAVAADEGREWLAMGVHAAPGEHLFTDYEYVGGEEFGLTLKCWGARTVDGSLHLPSIVLVPGRTLDAALRGYVGVLRRSGAAPSVRREQAAWWDAPILSGWGHQCYKADLFRIRSPRERRKDNATYMMCTQASYLDFLERIDARGVPWGTVIIDIRWFMAGGLKDVDIGRWPDLRGFVDGLHARGKRVLLWWGAWDPEGVPAEQCVRYEPPVDGLRNEPGRLEKFGMPVPGQKLAIDITLPAVRDRIRAQVRRLLGAGPDCYDADGFKIDYVSATPAIYGLAFPEGSGRLLGVEALKNLHALLYETAKEVKPDALISGQSPHPYFAGVQDMIRFGDTYTRNPDSVLAEMTFRAEMFRAADDGWLLDTGCWPMPSRRAFREYVPEQPRLGVPGLYYATHLDTTGEALDESDFALVRASWPSP